MKESIIIYESAYKAINYLPDEKLQLEAYKGLMEYGFYGIVPESENPFVNMVFVQAIPSMRSAAERYDASVENGKKGGRPTEVPTDDIIKMKQDGMTNKQIADKLGLSEKTIENRITIYNKSHPYNPHKPPITPALPNGGIDPHNPHNLTVSYTVSESSSVSDTKTDTGTVSSTEADTCPEDDIEDNEQYPQTKEDWLLWIEQKEFECVDEWRARLRRALNRISGTQVGAWMGAMSKDQLDLFQELDPESIEQRRKQQEEQQRQEQGREQRASVLPPLFCWDSGLTPEQRTERLEADRRRFRELDAIGKKRALTSKEQSEYIHLLSIHKDDKGYK